MKRFQKSSIVKIMIGICLFALPMTGWAQPSQPQGQPPAESGNMQEPPDGMSPPEQSLGEHQGKDEIRMNWQLLNLSAEQQAKMQDNRREFQINTANIREELKFAEQDLRAAINNEQVDRQKVDALLQNISTLKRKLGDAAIQNLLAIKAILTPEQREKFADLQFRLPPEYQKLNLMPEQRSQLQKTLKASLEKNKNMNAELRTLREDLREMLMAAGEVDAGKLTELQDQIAEKELTMDKARTDLMLELKQLLTPEQQKQLKEFRTDRKQEKSEKTKSPKVKK